MSIDPRAPDFAFMSPLIVNVSGVEKSTKWDSDLVAPAAWEKVWDVGSAESGEYEPSDRDMATFSPVINTQLHNPDLWIKAGKTGTYTYLETQYAESTALTGYKDYKQIALVKVKDDYIVEKTIYERCIEGKTNWEKFKNGEKDL